jgi:hypothetical protein
LELILVYSKIRERKGFKRIDQRTYQRELIQASIFSYSS